MSDSEAASVSVPTEFADSGTRCACFAVYQHDVKALESPDIRSAPELGGTSTIKVFVWRTYLRIYTTGTLSMPEMELIDS
jgi:hypothetical protein